MVLLIRKKHLLAAVTGAALLLGAAAVSPRPSAATVSATASTGQVVILDAGHGGADGGAVSDSGVPESGINLAITQRLGDVLSFCGHTVALTREGEDALCDGTGTLRQQKVSDTKKRVELVNSFSHGFLISIHQNSLPGHPKVHGAQVFYNAAAQAERLAAAVQGALNRCLQAGDERQVKAAPGSIFLLAQAKHPTILAECGFMSCPEECRRLQEPDYQVCLALVIASGVEQFLFEGYGGTA